MPIDVSNLKDPFVLFGNGEIPTHQIPIQTLNNAGSILCADGGADKLNLLGFKPKLILGDLDSASTDSFDCPIIELKDQTKTDLQKSLDWCIENGISEISLIGFSGEDDDHWMAALWTLFTYHEKLVLVFYSNHSKIFCVEGEKTISTHPGQKISIIPIMENVQITSTGLKYPIENHVLKPPSFGTRNEALGDSFFIKSSGPVWAFLNFEK